MLSFIVIIALIIVGFSLVFLVFNREDEYGAYLYEAYNVLYGPMDIDDAAPWPFSQKLIMAVLAFFLNVVLLNLLISIMGDSYGRVLEMRARTDSITRLELMSEAIIYKKLVKRNHVTKRGYLIYCLAVEMEDEENEQNVEWENRASIVSKVIQRNNEEMKQEILKTVKHEIWNLKASHAQELLTIKQKLATNEKELQTIKENEKEILSYLQKEFALLKTSIDGNSKKPIGPYLGTAMKKDLSDDNLLALEE